MGHIHKTLILILFLSSGTVFSWGADEPKNQLTLKVSVHRLEITQWQPVDVMYFLHNHGQGSVSAVNPRIKLEYAFGKKEFQQFDSLDAGGEPMTVARRVNILPGEKMQGSVRMLIRQQHPLTEKAFVFSEPGTYQVRARYYLDGQKIFVESDPITVVVNPVSQSDVAAAKLWADPDVGGVIQEHLGNREKALGRLTEIVQKYPHSAYAQYARTYLGLEKVTIVPKDKDADRSLDEKLRDSLAGRLRVFMAAVREGSTPPKRYFTEDFVWDGKLNRDQTAALLKERGTTLRTGGPYPDDLIQLEVVSFDRIGEEVMATVKITITPTGKPEAQQCQFILRQIDGNWFIRRWDGDILKRLEEK